MFPTIIQTHDDELQRHVIDFLVARGITHWEQLKVTVTSGVVVLHGPAGSEQEKQLTLQCCRRVAGVVRVVDRLKVSPPTGIEEEQSTMETTKTVCDEWIT